MNTNQSGHVLKTNNRPLVQQPASGDTIPLPQTRASLKMKMTKRQWQRHAASVLPGTRGQLAAQQRLALVT